jgi:hypothetical protein
LRGTHPQRGVAEDLLAIAQQGCSEGGDFPPINKKSAWHLFFEGEVFPEAGVGGAGALEADFLEAQ